VSGVGKKSTDGGAAPDRKVGEVAAGCVDLVFGVDLARVRERAG